MSSHIIIKDNQEPPLLVCELNSENEGIVESLLEWGPSILVFEEVLNWVSRKKIKIDLLIADDPDLAWEDFLRYQWPVKIIGREHYANELEGWFEEKGIRGLQIVGSFSQMYHTPEFEILKKFHPVIYSGHCRFYLPSDYMFDKWMSPGRGIKIWPEDTPVNIQGHLKEVGNACYETLREGKVRISGSVEFWVGELL